MLVLAGGVWPLLRFCTVGDEAILLNRGARLGQGHLLEALRRPSHRGGRLDNGGLSADRPSRGRTRPVMSALGLVVAGVVAASTAQAQEPAQTDKALPREVAPATALGAPVRQDDDPLQKVNRASFGFGMGLDRYVLAPITHAYQGVTPSPIRNRVSAVIYNLGEPGTAINDVAQGHPKHAGQTASRFIINSTIGVLGIFDVATDPYGTMRSAYSQRRASKVQSAKGQAEALPDFGPPPGDLEATGGAERQPSQPN